MTSHEFSTLISGHLRHLRLRWGLLLLLLLVSLGWQLVRINRQVETAQAQKEELAEQVESQQAENDALLKEMAKAVIQMVTESVDAYVKCDIMLAKKVIAADDVVDEQFARVKQSLIGKIAADPADGEYALDLLMIAKYYERIGDHATNIAEWVIYSVTGTHKDEITLT